MLNNINDSIKLKFLKNLGSDNSKEYWAMPFFQIPNTFEVFKSINNILYLIYATRDFSIISYDLMSNKIINVIKKAHSHFITSFNHYLDKNKKRDIIMSISGRESIIKLWDISNFECIFKLNLYESVCGDIISGEFLCYNNIDYIILAFKNNFPNPQFSPIKIYDFNKKNVKNLQGYDTVRISFVDIYYDKLLCRYFILICGDNNFQSYDFEEDKVLHKYLDGDNSTHYSEVVDNNEDIIKLIYPTYDGNIFIWDFYSGQLLDLIHINKANFQTICLWDKTHILVSMLNEIKIIDIKNKKIIKTLLKHNGDITHIKKIFHPIYGQCILSQDCYVSRIILWIINEK